jgi:tetraacyldisaccharide 4'-kinase
MDWARMHERKGFSLASAPLALLSLFYGLGVRLRLLAYRRMSRRSLPGFVVSVGNLTAGGTGKTPAACTLAEWAVSEGYSAAILSRGYGGRYMDKVLEVSDGKVITATAVEAGDEPYLMAKKLHGVPVIISKKRYLAGLHAHEKFGTNFFILDDGFQHLALKRDLDLVLLDSSSPFGNGHLLPWGPLREPATELKRADALILTRSGQNATGNDLSKDLQRRSPGKPLFRSEHAPEKVLFPNKEEVFDPEFLKGKRVLAFAGIARPEAFKETLIRLGAEVVSFKGYADHHAYKTNDMQELSSEKARLKAAYLLTTEKDWVRMEDLPPKDPDQAYLTIKFTLLDDGNRFFKTVHDKIAEKARRRL